MGGPNFHLLLPYVVPFMRALFEHDVQFLKPGITREMTHELSSSDRYGDFRHYIRMPLFKVEELTSLLIQWGYINQPRSYFRQQEYRERAEILVMFALYTLGNGALF